MITEETVYRCLALEVASDENAVNIAHHDDVLGFVLGVDALGRLTLVFSDIGSNDSVTGQFAEVKTHQVVTLEPSGIEMPSAAILYCATPALSHEETTALAALLVAICHLRSDSDERTLMSAIVGLASLLNRRALRSATASATIGIMGELIVLLSSRDPDFHFSCWRTDPQSDFDFSSEDSRLEVKTTTQAVRQHEFSSTQFIFDSSLVFIASVRLLRVESGSGLSQLVDQLSERLAPMSRQVLVDRVNATLGCPYQLVDHPQVDIENSIRTIRIWPQVLVPRPHLAEGILWARWGVLLADDQPTLEATPPLVSFLLSEASNWTPIES